MTYDSAPDRLTFPHQSFRNKAFKSVNERQIQLASHALYPANETPAKQDICTTPYE